MAQDKRFRPIRPILSSTNPRGGDYDTVITNIYDILRTLSAGQSSVSGNISGFVLSGATSGDILTTNDGVTFVPQKFVLFNLGVGTNLNVSGNTNVVGNVSISGAFAHKGTTFGVFNRTPTTEPAGFTVTNGTLDHIYNADATTLNELADLVYTIISKLASLGIWDLS